MSDSQPAKFPNRLELRFAPRFRCHMDLAIEWGSATLKAAVRDISSSGMFVELENPLWVGARFTAQLGVVDCPLFLHCDVRRVDPSRGMGISFQAAEEAGRFAIAALLERLAGRA